MKNPPLSTASPPCFIIPQMSHIKWLLVIALLCPKQICGQDRPTARVPFAGCYQVMSLVWQPPNEDIKLIPERFELRSESVFKGSEVFAVRSVPASGNLGERLWRWKPKGSGLWISWGTSFGGFRGNFKRSRAGEFVGRLKEWCDSRCEWKKRVGIIRLQQLDCPK